MLRITTILLIILISILGYSQDPSRPKYNTVRMIDQVSDPSEGITGTFYRKGANIFWNGTQLDSTYSIEIRNDTLLVNGVAYGYAGNVNQWTRLSGRIYPTTSTDDVVCLDSLRVEGFTYLKSNTTIDGRLILDDGGGSVLIGTDAGLNDDASANNNVFIGKDAGKANVGDNSNVAIGYQALTLYAGSTGASGNTAIGFQSHQAATSGVSNTSLGMASSNNMTSGDANTNIGRNSNFNNLTGSNNTTVGYHAGSGVGASQTIGNTAVNNSVYVGMYARSSANTQTNQTVIGYDAVGNGSNTVTLGDDNVVSVYMAEDAGAKIYAGSAVMASGTTINEFSIDGTLGGNSDDALPTEQAVKTYVDGYAQPLDADLTALAALTTTGIVVRTGAATYDTRTITGDVNEITVTNGGGVAGAPNLSIDLNKDVVATAPLLVNATTNVDNILVGADADLTLSITVDKDITASGLGMSGGANDVLPGADADVTITLTTDKDVVATAPLLVNSTTNVDDILPGADADLTFSLSYTPAYDDSVFWTRTSSYGGVIHPTVLTDDIWLHDDDKMIFDDARLTHIQATDSYDLTFTVAEAPMLELDETGYQVILGHVAEDNDFNVLFRATTNTGSFKYMEDEDLFLFEEAVGIKEITAPASIAGYGLLFFKTDQELYYVDGAGAEKQVATTSNLYGEMYMYEATQVITINTQSVYHAVFGFSTGIVDGWTFDAGSGDVGGGVNAEADATQLQVTTAGAHGLITGDIVSLSGMNNAGHNGVTAITLVDATNFTCDNIVYIAGAGVSTGTADEPSYLLAGAGAAGKYHAEFSTSGEPAAADTYKWQLNLNVTPVNNISMIREHSNNDIGNGSSGGLITVTAGMRLFLTVENTTGVNNFTIEDANVNLNRL